MGDWKKFCSQIDEGIKDVKGLRESAGKNFGLYGVYPDSIHVYKGSCLFIARDSGKKVLAAYGESDAYDRLVGVETAAGKGKAKVCSLDNANCNVIRSIFPYTNPANHKGRPITIGLGDRLGLASAGHIRLIRDMDVFPVLAQQSIRELNLTGRNYHDVLAAASWAVFQEGYEKGFGADGDHLKTEQEVKMALDCGFTMITLDCSEHIRNQAANFEAEELDREYLNIPIGDRSRLEAKFLGKTFEIDARTSIRFSDEEFKRTVLIYFNAIKHTVYIFGNVLKTCGRPVDFEMSIDETLTPTAPGSHFFVASELLEQGVDITSLAPRFCGEFQKGIDYRGDVAQFTREFDTHCKIARHFGYKISVHSGSDKFTVFPIVGEKTQGEYHLKTAGTNWLEAVRVIAEKQPGLYREMHKYALGKLDEARKYYHISADPANIPDIDTLKDSELPGLMNKDDSRQVLHITYGVILTAKNPDGSYLFKDRIYSALDQYEAEYYKALEKHIGRHLDSLGLA